MKAWIQAQFDKRNEEITTYNLTATKADRQVLVKARTGASQFTEIVKYTLDFRQQRDDALTSRYARALESIHNRFGTSQHNNDISEIVSAVMAAGGLEAVIHAARGKVPVVAVDDRSAIADAVATRVADQLVTTQAAYILNNLPLSFSGLFTLFGRATGGSFEVLAQLSVPDGERAEWTQRFSADFNLQGDPRAEFVSRALALGPLVEEGAPTYHTVDDTHAGPTLKVERVVALRRSDALSVPTLVVSAKHGDANLVVRASPGPTVIGLQMPEEDLVMPRDHSQKLMAMLAIPNAVHFTKIDEATVEASESSSGPQGVLWRVANEALDPQQTASAQFEVEWESVGLQRHKPLDIDGFSPEFEVALSTDDLSGLYEKCLADIVVAKKADAAKSGAQSVRVIWAKGQVEFVVDAAKQHAVTLPTPCEQEATMHMRPQDLRSVVQRLLRLKVPKVTLRADTTAMLMFSWDDDLGSYAVCIPTMSANGNLNPRCLAPMRGPSTKAAKIAAE